MTKKIKQKKLIERLFEKANRHKSITSNYYITTDLNKYVKPHKLFTILSLPEDFLEGNAFEVYSFFENENELDEITAEQYNDFKWKLSAFISIQDVFEIFFQNFDEPENEFLLWYFYYESKYILIESILCGFHGLYLSSRALTRLFLEFNINQNYFYRLKHSGNVYRELNKYFKSGALPSSNVSINGSLPKDSFCKPIKKRLSHHLTRLSKNSLHPYHPKDSVKQVSNFIPEHSIIGIFFWLFINAALQSVLWMYYVNFPILFQKTYPLKKFGFNGPVGVFADEQLVHIVKKSMSEKDYEEFKSYSDAQDSVKTLLEWHNSLDDLNEEQILKTWDEKLGKINTIWEGYAKQMSQMRATREMLALKNEEIKFPEISDAQLKEMLDYNYWKKIYKRV